jgi:hypothetical protein
MKKLPILLTAGAVLVTGFLASRVVDLERRLEAAESRQPVPLRVRAVKPAGNAPAIAPSSVEEEAPDTGLAAELASARAELAGLNQQIKADQQQRQSPGRTLDGVSDALITEPLNTAYVPSDKVVIEHWTGGDKRNWGHEQAAGAPDTGQPGDIPSAWASKAPDGGEEWLQLDYDRFVDLQQINVVESHNPGAISKVVAMLSNGREATVWEGTMDPSASDELVSSAFPVSEGLRARSVKVYLDTTRVPGWNEIDAVEIVGRDGSKQWASSSRASSSYADP